MEMDVEHPKGASGGSQGRGAGGASSGRRRQFFGRTCLRKKPPRPWPPPLAPFVLCDLCSAGPLLGP
jgi:hypothetical protein